MPKVTMSVHTLVDFALREGDLDSRVFNLETMTRGSEMHAYYQAKQNKRYLAEQYLEGHFTYDEYEVKLQGRVDGIIVGLNNEITIEEIKTTNSELEVYFDKNEAWHLGQAECYALMYARNNNLPEIDIQLTYISQVDESKIIKRYTKSRAELEDAISYYLSIYFTFYRQVYHFAEVRDYSLKALTFPFAKPRLSQQLMMDEVSEALKTKTTKYFNAPTGSGKTMAVLYPSLKHLALSPKTKIFYLTAKGSGKLQAENAMTILAGQTRVKSITLSAKEKMKVSEDASNDPLLNPYLQNYYGKLKTALLDIYMNYDAFTTEIIMETAHKHIIDPFEFQLDLSLLCDVIIADYNYLFDPFVYLRRFFETKSSEYIVLVDEAHNLPRRVNDNYSLTLDFSPLYALRKVLKGPEHKKVRLIINRIAKYLSDYTGGISAEYEAINEFPVPLLNLLETFLPAGSRYMDEQGEELAEEFRDLFFNVNKFLKLLAFKDESFNLFTTVDTERKFFPKFRLQSLNPARFIKDTLRIIDYPLFFSATLVPETYFKTLLAIEGDIHNVPSPFAKEQLLMLVDYSVSLYYKDRDATMDEVVRKIVAATGVKRGNYLVYAPSFDYLERLEARLRPTGIKLLSQNREMNDFEKETFLSSFVHNPQETTLGLAVLGGSFSEGVDLVSDRLSGVIILGVGYPPPTYEKENEVAYFDKILNDGNSYAYIYPALNKIFQTIGRVIRDEKDRGFVLLVDKRYRYEPYISEIRRYNGVYEAVKTEKQINELLSQFFYD